ncbi:hypothetical protein J2129_000647 [Methanofollis sp. W23]|uniref:hypothetical protein n=1 Tax=Methanofollis sp. W23 TaxID=2817849 RepID=UPI001AE4A899|nr:hypothetical protein [Methanofollis sp. W23]MBP2145193.1 hypothetical protein [Methanofollis sp. W23]
MSSGDLLSVAAGVVIVILVAFGVQWWGDYQPTDERGTGSQHPSIANQTDPALTTPAPVRAPSIFRISYVEKPVLKYKTYLIPDEMNLFGGSDPSWGPEDGVPFACLDATLGGVTETFYVPYQMWRMNCTVTSEKPASSYVKAALVDAGNNTVIKGFELNGPGHIIKNIQIMPRDYYLIIESQNALTHIEMETKPKFL